MIYQCVSLDVTAGSIFYDRRKTLQNGEKLSVNLKISDALCQLKSSQHSKIQPKIDSLGRYQQSVKCSDESDD